MINVSALSKTFQTKQDNRKTLFKALDNLSFSADDGQITALLGPNGAGKTTMLRILSGLETANAGAVTVNHLSGLPARKQLAYLSDGCGLYQRLTAYENISYFGELHGLSKSYIAQRIALLSPPLNLEPLLARKVAGFSQGERMRVAIARALIHDPQTIVLDEPTNGLDLASVRKLRIFLKYLASHQGGGKCILFSTHIMHEVEKIADKVVVIVKGQIKTIGTVAEISAQDAHADFEEAFVKLAFEEPDV